MRRRASAKEWEGGGKNGVGGGGGREEAKVASAVGGGSHHSAKVCAPTSLGGCCRKGPCLKEDRQARRGKGRGGGMRPQPSGLALIVEARALGQRDTCGEALCGNAGNAALPGEKKRRLGEERFHSTPFDRCPACSTRLAKAQPAHRRCLAQGGRPRWGRTQRARQRQSRNHARLFDRLCLGLAAVPAKGRERDRLRSASSHQHTSFPSLAHPTPSMVADAASSRPRTRKSSAAFHLASHAQPNSWCALLRAPCTYWHKRSGSGIPSRTTEKVTDRPST